MISKRLAIRKYFGKGDFEAFVGLFGDVFSKITAIIGVLYFTEGFPAELVMGKILPGIAVGSIVGCFIYFFEANDINRKENRIDVTALPFGISSGQVFAWLLLILVPIYRKTGDAQLAWQIGLAACFIGGFIEILGAFVSRFMVKYIPNSALMGNMAASALIWLSFNGFITVFQAPVISVVPLFLIIIAFKTKKPLIKGIPNSLLVLGAGAILAWGSGFCNWEGVKESAAYVGIYGPGVYLTDIFHGMRNIVPYLPIIVPLQIANFIATMQSVESAALAGDHYPVKRCMVLDGATTVLSAICGSPFPTSVYYGHPGWKKIGAKSGYALLMSLAYLTCFFGIPLLILSVIPYEVIIVLLVFVGITVTTEVIDNMEKEFSGVIFLSLFPIIAQYMFSLVNDVLRAAGTSISKVGMETFDQAGVMVKSLEVLSNGAFASSLLYAAWIAYIYKRNFKFAGYTAILLAMLSAIGFIHSPALMWLPSIGKQFLLIYLVVALLCFITHISEKRKQE